MKNEQLIERQIDVELSECYLCEGSDGSLCHRFDNYEGRYVYDKDVKITICKEKHHLIFSKGGLEIRFMMSSYMSEVKQ